MKIWSEDEIAFLKANYGKMFASKIAKKIKDVNERQVIYKAKRLGLKSSLKRVFNKEEKVKVINESGFELLEPFKGTQYKHKLRCPFCKKEYFGPVVHIIHRNQKSCGCLKENLPNRKGTDHISMSYFAQVKRGAQARNIIFDLSIQYFEELLIKQNFKCALSNWPIHVGYNLKNVTGSLDRIDSNIGYFKHNVQWLHKDVNLAKQKFSQEYFIDMCKNISENNIDT